MSPYFYSLSMLVSGRAYGNPPYFGAVDGLAYAIECEADVVDLPPLVERSVEIFMLRPLAAGRPS